MITAKSLNNINIGQIKINTDELKIVDLALPDMNGKDLKLTNITGTGHYYGSSDEVKFKKYEFSFDQNLTGVMGMLVPETLIEYQEELHDIVKTQISKLLAMYLEGYKAMYFAKNKEV